MIFCKCRFKTVKVFSEFSSLACFNLCLSNSFQMQEILEFIKPVKGQIFHSYVVALFFLSQEKNLKTSSLMFLTVFSCASYLTLQLQNYQLCLALDIVENQLFKNNNSIKHTFLKLKIKSSGKYNKIIKCWAGIFLMIEMSILERNPELTEVDRIKATKFSCCLHDALGEY